MADTRAQRNKEIVKRHKEAGYCLHCKSKKNLTFHHRDPSTKVFSLGNVKKQSIEQIQNEIAKCDLLCRDCHDVVHEMVPKDKRMPELTFKVKPIERIETDLSQFEVGQVVECVKSPDDKVIHDKILIVINRSYQKVAVSLRDFDMWGEFLGDGYSFKLLGNLVNGKE